METGGGDGSGVRRARETAGMPQSELGDLVPCDNATVSRVETGLLAPDEAFARACDAAFPHMDGWFTRFLRDSGGWAAAFEPSFRPFTEEEESASSVFVFENSVVPGLLQTREYAWAMFAAHPGVSEADIESRVAGRMARQTVLDRETPPSLRVVIDEMALHREVGGPEVMASQLEHMAAIAGRANVAVQVLTSRIHVGVQGAVNIAEKPGALSVAYVEDLADGRIAADHATVAMLLDRFRDLQSESLPATASRALIRRLAEQWRNQDQQPDGGSAATAAARVALASRSGSPAG
jgi:hypothetical protein